MTIYSRSFLMSRRFWRKTVCEFQFSSHYASSTIHPKSSKPLDSTAWHSLKSLGILRRFRGCRGGQPSVKNSRLNSTNASFSEQNTILFNIQKSSCSASSIPTTAQASAFNYPSKQRRNYRGVNFNNLTQVPIRRKTKGHSFPSIFLSNARSMVNKLDEIQGTLRVNSFSIGVITESWLSSRVPDDLISVPGYVTCRKDRPDDKRGGGICTYISSQINFIELTDLNNFIFESQWFLIKPDRLPRGINAIILAAIYHPPGNDDNELRSYLISCLDKALSAHPNSGIILLGDFNQFKPGNLSSSFKLKQLVTKATRGNNILDQAYSTLSSYYTEATILPPLGMSDHSSVLLQPWNTLPSYQPTTRITKYVCKAANKQAVYSSLQDVNWTAFYHLTTCEEQFTVFQSKISNTIDSNLPLRHFKLHPTDKPWFTADIKEAIANRQRAWVNGNSTMYKFYRSKVVKLCKSARRNFYHQSVLNTQHCNPKKWWDRIKQLSGQSKPASLSKMVVNGLTISGLDLAEIINDSFTKVSADMLPLSFDPIPVQSTPDKFIISSGEVESSIMAINEHKATGPDNIPNWLLKDCASLICRPVASIFNASISQGSVPTLWKCADVIPIAKISKPVSVDSDLRPISLTTVLSKVLEGFVFSWLCPIVFPQLDTRQFGGIKNSSTTHALVRLIHEWLQAAETPKTIIRSCLIDFSKAFDRIDHSILMRKLQILNVPPILLNWCAAFLSDRQQRVKIGQAKSNWRTINAGVPQGTKLGPLFFLVMINDLTTDAPIYKYVDDCTVFDVTSLSGDTPDLQKSLDFINQWINDNNMRINTKKTKELNICFAKSPPALQPLKINDAQLDCVQSTKLLGVWIQSDLRWDLHVRTICSKASKRLYALRCLKRSGAPAKDLCAVYCSFVRPIIEYACPVWHSSLTNALSDELELIQKRATKTILPGLSYDERLSQLNLTTLYERRDELCRRFYKTISRPQDRINDVLPPITKPVYSLRNSRKLPLFKCRTKRFQNSFIPYAVKKWDASP